MYFINMYHEICVRVRQCVLCCAMHKVDELYYVAGLVFHSDYIAGGCIDTIPICTTAATTIAAYISYVHMNSLCRTTNTRIHSKFIQSQSKRARTAWEWAMACRSESISPAAVRPLPNTKYQMKSFIIPSTSVIRPSHPSFNRVQ